MCFSSSQSESPDSPNCHVKSLLCTPIRNGKKDKVIGMSGDFFTKFEYNNKMMPLNSLSKMHITYIK